MAYCEKKKHVRNSPRGQARRFQNLPAGDGPVDGFISAPALP